VKKKIRQPQLEQGKRVPAPSDGGGSTQTELVRFSFKYLRVECADNCDAEELRAFTKRLNMLSNMTWQQVNQSHRHGAGFEKIPRAQLQVPCNLSEDVAEVLSFRYGHGKRPMLGYREGAVLHVLWVSHGHDAYAG
jgi:hypothetical protein